MVNHKSLVTKIHIGKTQLGMDDETYRQLLINTTGIASCSLMNEEQLQQVLNAMVKKGFKVRSKFWGNRAAPREDKKIYLAKITALLAKHNLPKEYADGIAKRSFKVDFVHWLQPWQLKKVVQMLSVYDHNKKAL
ncbi:gp16 family protein [Rodentibacter myodis]|uniref:GemA protein n=1 Tax=Rodentibacter myodis TaxID=1907939 RepID=A0A1V3JR69_9PAST|nr:regulatory protein GemA [Rodentibacter myodis]OOF59312.1 GemA protein [Rodentibacter myodis]